MEYRLSNLASIMALMVDLDPGFSQSGGIYARQDPSQLIVTYWRVKSLDQPQNEFTFQVRLNAGGSFDITYNGLPRLQYFINDRPFSTVWAFGIKPARWVRESTSLSSLPLSTGPQGALQIENRSFRAYMHAFLLPIAWAVLISSLLLLAGLPLAMYSFLTRPLNSLLKGVALLNGGRREVSIPVLNNDEVGFLTQSFNGRASELDSLIKGLEERVAARTADLQAANDQLRKLSIGVEQSPSAILITDLDANLEYTNEAFTVSTGYTFEEVRGKNPRFLKSGQTPAKVYEQMWAALVSGTTWRGEMLNRKKNGDLFWESTVIAPIRNEQGIVTHFVSVQEDITDRKLAAQEMERMAVSDPLTGLFNRRHFFTDAEPIFTRSQNPMDDLAVLMLDIDHFKRVNDTYGHQAGDAVLRDVARRILENLRPTDLLARYGGEEFVILLPRTSTDHAGLIADRLLKCVGETPVEFGGVKSTVSISLGLAHLDTSVSSLDELLSRADQAMYRAKRMGRNTWTTWEAQLTR